MSPEERREREARLKEAAARAAAQPNDVEALVWLGRRTAYLGRWSEAIEIYTRGLALHPDEPHLLRHRGHRFITVRDFAAAVADLSQAARVIKERPDEIEPDGLPNARNTPTGTLRFNVCYHLGLAHYLRGEFEAAAQAWTECLGASPNPDTLCATTYWLNLTLRRLGRAEEARRLLEPIHPSLDLIENQDYHRLLLLAKGAIEPAGVGSRPSPTLDYGLARWHIDNSRREEGMKLLEEIVRPGPGASFGAIAAEADLRRERAAP